MGFFKKKKNESEEAVVSQNEQPQMQQVDEPMQSSSSENASAQFASTLVQDSTASTDGVAFAYDQNATSSVSTAMQTDGQPAQSNEVANDQTAQSAQTSQYSEQTAQYAAYLKELIKSRASKQGAQATQQAAQPTQQASQAAQQTATAAQGAQQTTPATHHYSHPARTVQSAYAYAMPNASTYEPAVATAAALGSSVAGFNPTVGASTVDDAADAANNYNNKALDLERLRDELKRSSQKSHFTNAWRNALFAIIAVAAAAVLISMLFLPVLRIFGNSMTPTLTEGSMVVAVKTTDLQQGDIVAFYYNNKVLVKRVIAGPGSWVDISKDGAVKVNGTKLNEDYVKELSLGECDITLPYQVPDNRYFVMGDHRETSIDSRSSTIGCISPDQMVGRVVARILPLNTFGLIS